jgi:hypothetical protein
MRDWSRRLPGQEMAMALVVIFAAVASAMVAMNWLCGLLVATILTVMLRAGRTNPKA